MIGTSTVYTTVSLRLTGWTLPTHKYFQYYQGKKYAMDNTSKSHHSSCWARSLPCTQVTSVYHSNQSDKSLYHICRNWTVCMQCPMYEYLGQIKRIIDLMLIQGECKPLPSDVQQQEQSYTSSKGEEKPTPCFARDFRKVPHPRNSFLPSEDTP